MSDPVIPSAPPDFLRGVIAAMFTPCHQDGSLDDAGTAGMVEWLASRGCVRTVFARSGMGKMFTFTVAETKRFARTVREAARGRMGLLVGASGEWRNREAGERPDPARYTAQAVELTCYAQEIGADGAVHVMPQALAPQRGEPVEETMYRYFRAVHDASDLPLVLYQPGGLEPEYGMTPGLLRRLMALPRIAGMKVSTTEDAVFQPLAEVARGTRFALICGHEGYYLKGLLQGAVGVIGQGCTGYPEILDAVRRRYEAGDREGAARAQADVERGLHATRGLDGTVALKQYLIRKGARIEPWDRSRTEPYPPEIITRIERELDTLLATYARKTEG